MKISEMSDKTKEKHADHLLKFSCNIFTTLVITVLTIPLGIFLTNFIKNTSINLGDITSSYSRWEGMIFLIIIFVILYFSIDSQDRAYNIYNTLDENNT